MIVAAPMEEGPSVILYIGLMVALCIGVAVVVPPLLRRFSLSTAVIAIALVGPLLALVGAVIGAGTMTLSGREITYTFAASALTGLAMLWVGLRVARPVAKDLRAVVTSIDRVASGERTETAVARGGEVGRLAGAVDGLSDSLAVAETERAMAEEERLAVVTALSHDLRTPMAALLVSVEALQDGVGSADRHLRAIRHNVLALERLVDDLFLLARAESGSLALKFELFDLGELLDEAVEAVSPVAAAKSVRLLPSVDGPLPVRGDHVALGRVWRNLLDNAIRHAPNLSDVKIDVRCLEGAELPHITVEVVDQGPGFEPEFTDVALEQFRQADDARTGGAGLGLSIVNVLVEAHQGDVSVFPGPGGRVMVRLPAECHGPHVRR